ncbi:MAG: hypothetical protein HOY75_09510 [Streptomyces sp.]|nr:hypothetical protein [Streptomyces sp.]
MAVEIQIKNGDETVNYGDVEGREYRYEIGEQNGTLAVYSKPDGGRLERNQKPDIIYGPSAWVSVSGDPKTRADAPKSTVTVH